MLWSVQLLAALAALAAILSCCSAQLILQTTRFLRPQDLDRILNNDRLLNTYIKCLLDQVPCSQEGRDLRKTLPQALSTGCAECTSNQRLLSDRIIHHLMTRRPRDWTSLVAKYDPKGEYMKRFVTTTPATNKKQTAPKPTASTAPAKSATATPSAAVSKPA